MIEVPVRVRDALREGNLKKEYRFKVYKKGIFVDAGIVDNHHNTIDETGYYMFHCTVYFSIGYQSAITHWLTVSYNAETERYESEAVQLNQGTTLAMAIQQGSEVIRAKYSDEGMSVDFTINNNSLVSESVKFDERMCSGTDLKFGLCEGTSLEFQYFNHESIKDKRLQAFVDVQYKDTDNTLKWYTIPMGWFTVDSISRQASTGIMKATAYNKLQSTYLDSVEPVKDFVSAGECGIANQVSVYALLNELLEGFAIEEVDPGKTLINLSDDDLIRSIGPLTSAATIKPQGSTANYTLYVRNAEFTVYNDNQNSSEYYQYRIWLQKIYQYLQNSGIIKHWTDALVTYNGTTNKLEYFAANNLMDIGGNVIVENINGVELYRINNLYKYYLDNDHSPTYLYTPFFTNNTRIKFQIPIIAYAVGFDPTSDWNLSDRYDDCLVYMYSGDDFCVGYKKNINSFEEKKITINDITSGVTLRDLQSAVFEVNCEFGKLDRETDLFRGVELNNLRRYPADTLYPADNLYPNGTAERGTRAMYSKLWADEGNVRSFRYLIIVYKTIVDGNEVDTTLQRTVNANGTDDYNMSDNWLFRNLTWTAADVGAYADAMVLKMQGLRWFPFEMWCAGLPYLETGDEIEINLGEEAHTSYVLNRTLSGIQNLQDEMINGTLDIF